MSVDTNKRYVLKGIVLDKTFQFTEVERDQVQGSKYVIQSETIVRGELTDRRIMSVGDEGMSTIEAQSLMFALMELRLPYVE